MKPYVDYYAQHEVSPVWQDISDLDRHFDRRRSLYRSLGLVPALLEGRAVIEFGPGSGHNALYTGSLGPKRYVLVDGNPVGLNEARTLLREHLGAGFPYEIVPSLIEDFESDERFDLAICEGTIPFQLDPPRFARKVASFCKPGGVAVVTTSSAASFMGEIARHLIASRLVARGAPLGDQLDVLRPIFARHLATLPNMSRSVDHWIIDNITQPLIGRTFSVEAAVDALGDEFEIYGQSPHFVEDWRWYKDVWGPAADFNGRAKAAYLRNVANFLDYRIVCPAHAPEAGRRLSDIAESIYDLMQDDELRGVAGALDRAAVKLGELAAAVAPISPLTAESLEEAARFVSGETADVDALPSFASYFGRGQQYLSFIRRAG